MEKSKHIKPLFSFYPFLFAMFPILFFYSHNINEIFIDVVFVPLITAVLFTTLLFLIFNIFLKDQHKASILVSLFLFLFFSYGHVHNTLGDINFYLGDFILGKDKILFPTWTFLFIGGAFILTKPARNLYTITKIFSVVSLFLVVISLFNILSYEIKTGRILRSERNLEEIIQTTSINTKKVSSPPDIYYLILDRYAGQDTLNEFYGYDNSEFVEYLTSKGFFVADKSRANYPKTLHSLTSSLNMGFIDDLKVGLDKNSSDETVLHPLIQNHKVLTYLKSNGYKYLHLGSEWGPLSTNEFADENFNFDPKLQHLGEFSTKLLTTTMIFPVLSIIFPDISSDNSHRNIVLFQFNTLAKIPEIEENKFVFAHILIPHEPYVFGKNCEFVTAQESQKRSKKANYLNQLSCTNKKLKWLVNQLVTKSKRPPIIILQADEGPHPIKNRLRGMGTWKKASRDTLKEKLGILNALYLPDIDEDLLYPSMTPVNTFRLIFNNYFGADYKLLPNRSYVFEDLNHIYKFIDVTDKVD
jgi:hypothetical protein